MSRIAVYLLILIIIGFLLSVTINKPIYEIYTGLGAFSLIMFLIVNRTVMLMIFSVFGRYFPPSYLSTYAEERGKKLEDQDMATKFRWVIISIILFCLGYFSNQFHN